jgi:hypothetical protein
MVRQSLKALVLVALLAQISVAQEATLKKTADRTYSVVAAKKAQKAPSPPSVPCIELDVLIATVVFDQRGELRVGKEGAEPEVNRAGTIGGNLAAKLNEEKGKLPAGVSPGGAGANLLLQGLAGTEALESLEQMQLRMLANGAEAHLQNGGREPRITGSSTTARGVVNNVELENIGTMITGSAKTTRTGKLAMQLTIERSVFGPEEEGLPIAVSDGKTIRTPRLDILTAKTEISAADGESIVLCSFVHSRGDKVTEMFIVVTPTVVKP